MNRIVVLAAALAAIALPASAQSIRISTEGKSADQVRAEVFRAARKLCSDEVPGSTYRIEESRACVEHTMRATLAQSHDPNLRLALR